MAGYRMQGPDAGYRVCPGRNDRCIELINKCGSLRCGSRRQLADVEVFGLVPGGSAVLGGGAHLSDKPGRAAEGHVVGGEMKYRFRCPEGIYVLAMGCPTPDLGWRFTFDGGAPHGGLFESITPGTKVMVQAIGPERFHMRYVD